MEFTSIPETSLTTLTFGDIDRFLRAVVGQIEGTTMGDEDEEEEYNSVEELWKKELVSKKKGHNSEWYTNAYNYWEAEANCPISDDGVLGGYGKLTPTDSLGSNNYLDKLKLIRPELKFERAADCGAGIGRVSKFFLLNRFNHVDLIEQSPRLLEASTEYIGKDSVRTTKIVVGLQDFNPAPNTYDCIWIQWVIGHLHDLDFISFFQRCALGLKEGGVIVLKDNCCSSYTFVVDKSDSSVARCREYIRLLFKLAGLDLILEETQVDFPPELYPVVMFTLVPTIKHA